MCGSSDVLTPKGRVRLDAADYDPATGEVRGLLRPGCRRGLDALERNADRLRQAAAYVERAPGHADRDGVSAGPAAVTGRAAAGPNYLTEPAKTPEL